MAAPPLTGTSASGMQFEDLLKLSQDVRARIETEWQRVINAHAALIAVMVFFASRPELFVAARLVVFAFYTAAILISLINLNQSYRGLRILTQEMVQFPHPPVTGPVLKWLLRSDYRADSWLRLSVPVLVWALVGYLLILPLIMGRFAPLQ